MLIRLRRLTAAIFCCALFPLSWTCAEIAAVDNAPGATLLFPYFEVDLDDPNGINTVLSWRNASASAALTHVTVWTDLGIPALDFDVYLTGYDVASLDLRELLDQGTLPLSASAGQDPMDQISPQGMFSQDLNFPNCNGLLPLPDLPANLQAHVRALTTGQPDVPGFPSAGLCAGANHGDNVARGYVTVDVVGQCSAQFPSDPGYFGFVPIDNNMLSGEYLLYDPSTLLMHSGAAASLEASATDPATTTSGNYTFYGRYVGFDASDHREPLATTWAVDAQAHRTEMIIWRDSKSNPMPFACGSLPPPFPLSQTQIVVFDRKEQPLEPPLTFLLAPFATQRVAFGGTGLAAPLKPGWAYLNLNTPTGSLIDPLAQSFISVLQFPEFGQQGGAADATVLEAP